MAKKGSILIVDDEPLTVEATCTLLKLEDYEVHSATNRKEAFKILERESIQLVVIDLCLEAGKDPNVDISGVELAREIDPDIPKIILTAHNFPNAILDLLNPGASGNRLAHAFILKTRGPRALLEAVQAVFSSQIHYNAELNISFEKGLSFRVIVDLLKGYRDRLENARLAAEGIVEDMIRRLFDRATRIKLLRMDPGRGGCAVVRAQPYFNAPGSDLVIKLGPKASINREYDNYRQYVQPYAENQRSSQITDEPVRTIDLGAIKYRFLGGQLNEFQNFKAFYHNHDLESILLVIDDLFDVTCEKWYGSARPPSGSDRALGYDFWFRQQLNLDAAHVDEIEGVLDQMLRSENRFAIHLERIGEQNLRLKLGKLVRQVPNPAYWAFHGGCTYPLPSLLAITHGDLNASNILVDEQHQTWLIDFFHTGIGPILRDIQELESVVKFELLASNRLHERYLLEQDLVAKVSLDDSILVDPKRKSLYKAAKTIEHLRKKARQISDSDDIKEYYYGLLFYALKYLTMPPSGLERVELDISSYHALLAAALACQMLKEGDESEDPAPAPPVPSGKDRIVFLGHEYREPWLGKIYRDLKPFIQDQGYQVRHPKDEAPGGALWNRIAQMISASTLGMYEITTMNGNVCFELGYAMSRMKPYFALVNTDSVRKQEIPPLLQGDWWVGYRSDLELKEQTRRILAHQGHPEPWHFFEQPGFQDQVNQVQSESGSALLVVANTAHLRDDLEPVLSEALKSQCNFYVKEIHVEEQVDLAYMLLQIKAYELVVGCFSSDEANNARYANAEMALVMGMVGGANVRSIMLQEKGGAVLADVRAATREFSSAVEAVEVLLDEVQRLFPGRGF